jgi:hypothetical protein
MSDELDFKSAQSFTAALIELNGEQLLPCIGLDFEAPSDLPVEAALISELDGFVL